MKLNPGGPLPNKIKYFPEHNIIRYRPQMSGVVLTLDIRTSTLLIQGHDYKSVLKYSERVGVSLPFSVNVDRVLFPSEAASFQVSLGDVCNLLQNRTPIL
jgi:hypothetical protein